MLVLREATYNVIFNSGGEINKSNTNFFSTFVFHIINITKKNHLLCFFKFIFIDKAWISFQTVKFVVWIREGVKKKPDSCGHVRNFLTSPRPRSEKTNIFFCGHRQNIRCFFNHFSICISIDSKWSKTYDFEGKNSKWLEILLNTYFYVSEHFASFSPLWKKPI